MDSTLAWGLAWAADRATAAKPVMNMMRMPGWRAAATRATSMPSAPGRTSWVANSATYKGAWAGGMALAHRLDTAVPLALSVGYAYGGDNSHGVRAGLGREF